MIAYKGFKPGLICRGYHFRMGLNVTSEANCKKNGFHAAENPLDCLSYYSGIHVNEYCLVDAGGDIDEDNVDSKISCTELTVLKILSLEEFFLHALAYMVDHPLRPVNSNVQRDRVKVVKGFAIVRGRDPLARGKLGDFLAYAKEGPTNLIEEVNVYQVDGQNVLPNVWYDIYGNERQAKEK